MDFGMPTLLEHRDLWECVVLCKALGLAFIELNMNLPAYQVHRIDLQELADAMEYGIYFTVHLEEELNVWSFNQAVADAYTGTALQVIGMARELSMPVVNLHMHQGVSFTLPGEKVYLHERYLERYLEQTRRFRDRCDAAVGEADVTLCVENCNGYPDFVWQGIDCLLESPVFQLTYDIGHDHRAGGVDRPRLIERRDRLAHMHVHDSGGEGSHLAVGDGEIDIPDRLALARDCGCRCVLETKTVEGLTQSVQRLRAMDGVW